MKQPYSTLSKTFLSQLLSCRVLFVLASLLACISVAAQAEDRLAQIFQDNMVLQREKPVPVWGWAAPGVQIEVAFAGQKKQAKADEHGYWKAVIDPLTANPQGQTLEVRTGSKTLTCKNVLVGEVWMATGQSNMVAEGPDQDTGVYPHYVSPGTKGGKPEIRVATYGVYASLKPTDEIYPGASKSWEVFKEDPAPESIGPAYYFARVVRDAVDVPVGIILVAVPGTSQAAWMEQRTLEKFPAKEGQGNFYQECLAYGEAGLAKLNYADGKIKSWADLEKADAAWRVAKQGRWPGGPKPTELGLHVDNFPSVLYNTRIYPLAPFAVRGAIWHQGEAGPKGPYGQRLVAMARQWRALFGQDFDFIWGTLARDTSEPPPINPMRNGFYRSDLNPEIRDALKQFGDDKHVALVELYDLGYWETHFLEKNEMGRRMGLAALTVMYGKKEEYTGPRMVETKIQGGHVVAKFEHIGNGLVYQPSIDGISGFYLCGKDGMARWASQVKITGKDTVEFSNPEIAAVETVAYGDNKNPHETLFNSAGLPASPFVINPPIRPKPQQQAAANLVSVQGDSKDVALNVCHVRRTGYVFQLKNRGATGSKAVTVQAYIPAEWNGFEVTVGGRKVDAPATAKDGNRFVTFAVPVDRSWVVVAENGKAAEFQKVNRF